MCYDERVCLSVLSVWFARISPKQVRTSPNLRSTSAAPWLGPLYSAGVAIRRLVSVSVSVYFAHRAAAPRQEFLH